MKGALPGISLVVCDLAGTTVDYGSRAPVAAFIEVFARHGVSASEAEARAPMGRHKRDHIEQMLSMPPLAERWRNVYGRDWSVGDVDSLFREFEPIQMELLDAHAEPVPGAAEAVAAWRAAGMKVAATTGYNRPMTDRVLRAAARRGLSFDFSCCATEVPAGRPAPWMIFRCMEALGAYPPSAVLAIGDTTADIGAGLNAGVWSVGVFATGNMLGLSLPEAERLSGPELAARRNRATAEMVAAGAHAVVDSIVDATELVFPSAAGRRE